MIRKILVPIDFHEPSHGALIEACKMAGRTNAELVLLYVDAFPARPAGALPYLPEQVVAEHADAVRRRMDSFVAEVARHGCRPRTRVVSGDVQRGILDAAAEEQADLIVMGTHGRRGLLDMLLGSVTEQIVRASPIPVLAVHEAPEARL